MLSPTLLLHGFVAVGHGIEAGFTAAEWAWQEFSHLGPH
jgi:hypothetical protein